jgi:Ca2+-binding RTX toxin-like protein
MFGGNGSDTLTGGAGNDDLTGGAGVDTFVFSSQLGNGNIDTVADFNGANEIIRLDHTYFAGLMGTLTAAQFSLNSPTGAAPQIVYDTASGALSYASGGTQQQFAVMANNATLSASSFVAF